MYEILQEQLMENGQIICTTRFTVGEWAEVHDYVTLPETKEDVLASALAHYKEELEKIDPTKPQPPLTVGGEIV